MHIKLNITLSQSKKYLLAFIQGKLATRQFLILFILISLNGFSQTADSLIKYKDLKFKDEVEKNIFINYLNKNDTSNFLPFLYSLQNSTDNLKSVEETIRASIDDLKKKTLNAKSEGKIIKTIYVDVHEKFLKKYELKISFAEIFKNGTYNCVTATALYSLILDGLKIPYSIKETPTHVFMVAYPNSSKVLIETTNPLAGYYQFNEDFVKKYVENLLKSKQISDEDYKTNTANDLFNKYYFSSDHIDLKKLTGLHYYNAGIVAMEETKYEKAMDYFSKAYIFYPSDRVKFLIRNTLALLLEKVDYKNDLDIERYIIATRLNSSSKIGIDFNELKNEFLKITEKQLIDQSNFELYENSYKKIVSQIGDTVLLKEINFTYNYEFARVLVATGKTQGLEEKLQKAYSINPNNAYLQAMILQSIVKKLSNKNNPNEVISLMNGYEKDYPFVNSSLIFNRILANSYLEFAYREYNLNNSLRAEQGLVSFEKIKNGQEGMDVEDTFIEKAYGTAAGFYFKKGDKEKAKTVLMRGLKFLPQSYHLKQRLSQLY